MFFSFDVWSSGRLGVLKLSSIAGVTDGNHLSVNLKDLIATGNDRAERQKF